MKHRGYLIITPENDVYGGITTLELNKRWNYGNGYVSTPTLGDSIRLNGWDAMRAFEVFSSESKTETEMAMRGIQDLAGGHWIGKKYKVLPTPPDKTAEELFGFTPSKSIIVKETVTPLNNAKMKQKQTKKMQPMAVRTAAGVKCELTLDTRYLRQDGQYPVTIRMYQNGKYKYLQTGYSSTPTTFPSFTPAEEDVLMKRFDSVCSELTQQLTRNGINDIMSVGAETRRTSTLEDVMAAKRDMMDTQATRNNYTSTLKILAKIYPNGLPCERISSVTVGRVLDWLNTNGYSPASSNIYLSAIKASINYGIYKGWVKPEQYPFKKNAYEVDKVVMPQSPKRDDHYLTLDEMHKLWAHFTETKNPYLGMFLFSYLNGGMNIADMLKLKFDDFYFKEGGFRFQREKTRKKNAFKTAVPVTKWTDELLQIMGIEPQKDCYVFAKFLQTDKDDAKNKANISTYINKTMWRLSEMLYLSRKVSMTYARHTYCTIATKIGAPYSMIETAMAHSLGGVSSHYIGGFSMDEMRQWHEKLL